MFKRTLEDQIEGISNSFPVILLTGPRQVGKTTLLELCSKGTRNYVTLDDLKARNLAKNDPELFLQRYKTPLIIDEVQYAPELFSYIKIIVDREKKNGLFWLTGSQKFHLMKGISETLAGRVAILDLLGLSQKEINNKGSSSLPFIPTQQWIESARSQNDKSQKLLETFEKIWLGSFPKVYQKDFKYRELFYSSYVQTYIERDVRDILKINDELTFYNFLCLLAARTGQTINYSEISKTAGIDNKTVKLWMSVLETSGLIYLLQPYHSNISKRIVKSPKLYFLDTGLCSYLTKWPTSESLEAGNMSGAILETYIFSEILKSYFFNAKSPNLYYYRDTDKKEIDLIIQSGNTLHPIEFKKTANPTTSSSKNFKVLETLNKKIGHGAVICFVESDIPISNDVTAIPVNYL